MTSEEGASGGMEEHTSGESMPIMQTSEPATSMEEGASATAPQGEGRRTQLKIVREGVESIRGDVWAFRRKHDSNDKKLDADLTKLRKDLAALTHSKEVGDLSKRHAASSKKLEKDVATLRSELAALKSSIAKDAARSRAKQEAMLSRILSKVSTKPKAKPAAKPKASKKKK